MGTRCFALITGASRGFGKSVAEELVRKLAPLQALDVILVARSAEGLQGAAASIESIVAGLGRSENVSVRQESVDLADVEGLEDRLSSLFADIDPTRYSRAVLVNNAASIGHIGRSNDQTSLRALKEYMDLNVTSCIWITTQFSHLFGAHGPMKSQAVEYKGRTRQPTAETTGDSDGSEGGDRPLSGCKSVVVHVSSVMAMKPIKYFANYAAGKAARDMFHKVLALEQAEIGGLKVLNYAPGPMDTDMSAEVRNSEHPMSFSYVDVDESAKKCVRLAFADNLEPGEHVDFSDDK